MPRTPRLSKIPSPSPIRIPYPHTQAESAKCYSLTVPGSNLSAFARAKAMSTRSLRISRIPTSILSACLRNWLAGLHNGCGTHSDVLALSLTPASGIRCQIAPNRYSSNTAIFERIAQCRVGYYRPFSRTLVTQSSTQSSIGCSMHSRFVQKTIDNYGQLSNLFPSPLGYSTNGGVISPHASQNTMGSVWKPIMLGIWSITSISVLCTVSHGYSNPNFEVLDECDRTPLVCS